MSGAALGDGVAVAAAVYGGDSGGKYMNKNKVAIFGGGIAGMTAAHELIERGFEVDVYEMKSQPGGKARSIPFAGSGTDGRQDLPGEHGFRFFPGFYRHLPQTMRRIPYGNNKRGVLDNLASTTRALFSADTDLNLVLAPGFPRSWAQFKILLRTPAMVRRLKVPPGDIAFFFERIMQIATSCRARRTLEYERISWWHFVEADTRSKQYARYFVAAATRTLVAAKAKLASTKTIGEIGVKMISGMMSPSEVADRLLNGPTNQVFIDPWLAYLRSRGVHYHLGTRLTALRFTGGTIGGATVERDGESESVLADYYLCALPVEKLAPLITQAMIDADARLGLLKPLSHHIAWMNGIQFYLRQDVAITHGHAAFLNTPWALTSISQAQFWSQLDLRNCGDGDVRGVLSVDISDWVDPGEFCAKPAKDLDRHAIAHEVWEELKARLNIDGATVLADENRHSWFIDPDITNVDDNPSRHANLEPLLVNEVNTWALRPEAATLIHNFFIAGDFVRTNTDLATMESANEAGRRAANAILEAAGSNARPSKVYSMGLPWLFAPFRWLDARRYRKGLNWNPPLRFVFRLIGSLAGRLLGVA